MTKTFRLFTVFTALFVSTQGFAANIFWGNPGAGNWNVATNWVGNVVPGNDDARITNGGIAIIDASQDISTGFATLGDSLGTTGTLQMTGGKLTTISSDIRVGGNAAAAGGTGYFDQSGGLLTMNFGNFNIGFGTNAHGTYNLSGGSVLLNTAAATVVLAVGNRGVGIVNQTGGSFFIKAGNGFVQLGRNVATGTGWGYYNLSGGSLAVGRLIFGDAAGIAGSTNIFNLSGTGVVRVGTIYVKNTSASNSFNFTGGTLLVTNLGMSLRNSGGLLNPTFFDFGNAVDTESLASNIIATLTFTNPVTSFVQEPAGTLAIDISSSGNDVVDLGAGSALGTAALAGTLKIHFVNNFNPPPGVFFDILTADSVTNTAAIEGSTVDGNRLAPSITTAPDGRAVLRLTVVEPPPDPILENPVKLPDGAFQFHFTSIADAHFTTLRTTNITLSSLYWEVLGKVPEVSPGQYQFTDATVTNGEHYFYRVRVP
jgi:hypothetical protein